MKPALDQRSCRSCGHYDCLMDRGEPLPEHVTAWQDGEPYVATKPAQVRKPNPQSQPVPAIAVVFGCAIDGEVAVSHVTVDGESHVHVIEAAPVESDELTAILTKYGAKP